MRRTPQEKKRLSYAKDRRNAFGENDKGSRRAIRVHKRAARHANRRHDVVTLHRAVGAPDATVEAAVEERLDARRRASWRKSPDAPLGEIVEGQLRRRVRLGISTEEAAAGRLRRIAGRTGTRRSRTGG